MDEAPYTAAEAEREAEKIREDLAETLEQLKGNLRPAQLAHEAWETTRAHTPEWLVRYWNFARSPAGLALIGAAGVSLAGGLVARKQAIRHGRLDPDPLS